MSDDNTQICLHCNGQLVEIDHYGERLIGCVKCNKWNWRGGKGLEVELPQDDLEARPISHINFIGLLQGTWLTRWALAKLPGLSSLLNVLMNPIDEYVCKVEVVVVHHQHMAVAVDFQVVRKGEEGRISAGLLKSSNCGLAA
jgi:hypothetical protein